LRDSTLVLVSSPHQLAELTGVIGRPKFDAILARIGISREQLLTEIQRLAEIINPLPLPKPVSRDPDDDAILAVAIAARADLISSGDGDLLSLGQYGGIEIVSPSQAVAQLAIQA
jgi:uncharacterized protein